MDKGSRCCDTGTVSLKKGDANVCAKKIAVGDTCSEANGCECLGKLIESGTCKISKERAEILSRNIAAAINSIKPVLKHDDDCDSKSGCKCGTADLKKGDKCCLENGTIAAKGSAGILCVEPKDIGDTCENQLGCGCKSYLFPDVAAYIPKNWKCTDDGGEPSTPQKTALKHRLFRCRRFRICNRIYYHNHRRVLKQSSEESTVRLHRRCISSF